ncbi:MAG TPA: ABC-F family ATP-binding cassette domain-containing protein [Bdellovibrionota bacterium]|jgi:ATP-binding cassette subfamily F protein uup
MAILIGAQNISKTFAERFLFKDISFALESGERVGLIGPNGAGKSTLLRILAGKSEPDSGKLSIQRGLKIGYLEQVPQFTGGATVQETAMEGAFDQHEWEEMARCQELLSKLELTDYAERPVAELSGGWKKRVAIVRELMKQPDLLLLDEPTNHLDVESILWLEEFLADAPFATLTITHDRVFLQKVSTRIIEVNRKYPLGLLSIKGDYIAYLEAKDALFAQQASTELKLRNTLRRETEWLRRGAKARTTKQQARIQRHGELVDEVEELAIRNAESSAKFDFQGFDRNPKRLVDAEKISKSYDGKLIVPPLDLLLTPKSRIGLLGANGCGKSTLIRMLIGQEVPDGGKITRAEAVKVSYFEQNRDNLDPELSVMRTICGRGDHVDFGGSRVHVRSYLDRFLFSGNMVDMAVGKLSGGEQSRLLLAILMLQESNLLVLDEPTNDLDITTLDLLQEVLQDFNGAVLVATHDRYFIDQVSTTILGFGKNPKGGKTIEKFANLAQWEAWHEKQDLIKAAPDKGEKAKETSSTPAPEKKKLGFKEQRELDGMEETIQKKESRLAELTAESAKPELAANATKLLELTREMSQLQKEIDRLYARWQELTS